MDDLPPPLPAMPTTGRSLASISSSSTPNILANAAFCLRCLKRRKARSCKGMSLPSRTEASQSISGCSFASLRCTLTSSSYKEPGAPLGLISRVHDMDGNPPQFIVDALQIVREGDPARLDPLQRGESGQGRQGRQVGQGLRELGEGPFRGFLVFICECGGCQSRVQPYQHGRSGPQRPPAAGRHAFRCCP